jgi:pimeloyl-ACP methyl ester carboxylesterase
LTTDLRKRVADVRTPTLVLVPWEPSQPQDAATTLDLYRKQYAGLTQAQVKIIKGSRHFLTFDQPIVTNWAIEEFLGGCAH